MSETWENIQKDIDRCDRCIKRGHNYVKINKKKKHPSWKPEKVNILFITEAPPTSGNYFYEPEKDTRKRGMRENIFEILNISDINEFMEGGYFLIDSVKCPSEKNYKNEKPSRNVRKECNEFLHREIKFIKPDKICISGTRAFYAFSRIFPDLELGRIKNNRKRLRKIKIKDKKCNVIITYFPSKRNNIEQIKEDLRILINS